MEVGYFFFFNVSYLQNRTFKTILNLCDDSSVYFIIFISNTKTNMNLRDLYP